MLTRKSQQYKLNDLVRIINQDDVGIITRLPTRRIRCYEISTLKYPYGQWVKQKMFYPLNDTKENIRIKNKILKRRYLHRLELKCKPYNIDPLSNITLIAYNRHSLNHYGFIVWVDDKGFIPHMNVVFPGDEYGRIVRICLGSSRYWHRCSKLNEEEKNLLTEFLNKKYFYEVRHWDLAVEAWEKNIPSKKNNLKRIIYRKCIKVDEEGNMLIPDYMKLK